MNVDELQRLASTLRWFGLAITALGVVLTFGSHYIADKLFVAQAADKTQAQKRLKLAEAELEQTKLKTAELAQQLAPRKLTEAQRRRFIAFLQSTPKGSVAIEHAGQLIETMNFTDEVRSLLVASGFTISSYEMPLGYVVKAPAPWHIGVIIGTGHHPAYAEQLLLAFKEVGIEALATDGTDIAGPGQVKIHIGAK